MKRNYYLHYDRPDNLPCYLKYLSTPCIFIPLSDRVFWIRIVVLKELTLERQALIARKLYQASISSEKLVDGILNQYQTFTLNFSGEG